MTNPNDFQQMHQSSIFKKTKWSPEEDNLLRESIAKNGTSNWTVVASALSGRSGKQCRERWMNQLDPNLNKDDWKPADDLLLYTKHSTYGNSWVTIAKFFPGRSPNSVKNRWSWLTRHHFNPFNPIAGKPFIQRQMASILRDSNCLTPPQYSPQCFSASSSPLTMPTSAMEQSTFLGPSFSAYSLTPSPEISIINAPNQNSSSLNFFDCCSPQSDINPPINDVNQSGSIPTSASFCQDPIEKPPLSVPPTGLPDDPSNYDFDFSFDPIPDNQFNPNNFDIDRLIDGSQF
ncbi:hypothetical protein M9Y10_022582 [Tritrichomonas musculus]|uniref:Myb-like DNA-binding domain containing protein n=1 Tax=Tritrichomonas musculus TaxID=1915356 RepID=A0ABR2KSN0_9EUKA